MENQYFVDSDKLSEAALEKNTALKTIPPHVQTTWSTWRAWSI